MEKKKDYCSILSLLPDYYEIENDTLDQLWMAGNEEQVKDELLKHDGEANFKFVLENGFILRSETNFMTGKDRYLIDTKKITEFLNDRNGNGSFYLKLDDGYLNNSKPADSIHHVSVVCNEVDGTVFETLQQFNNLKTLLFLGKHRHKIRQLPDQLFLSFAHLRALDLSRTQITELPSSVGHMIHLRYLDLSWTLIEWLPDIICFLTELQTLKLRGCSNLCELPAEFRRLTNLRHLDLDVLRQLETMPKELGALVNLQTLSAFLVGTEEGFKIQELKDLNKLAGKFCIAMLENVESADEANEAALREKDQIKTLELRWTASQLSGEHFDSFEILKSLEPSRTLEELRILCYEGSEIPRWISDPGFDKLACITFYKCKNLSKLPPIEHLPLLKYLRLVKMTNIEKIEFEGEQRSSGAFSSLEKVEIDEMQSLIVWDWERRNDDDLKSLTQLTVNDCPELHRFNVVRHLVSIKHLEIRECPKLESLSDTEVPRSLEELIVEDCPHLQKKYSEHEGGDWFKVKHVPNIHIR